MQGINELKRSIKKKIDSFNEDKLNRISKYLETLEPQDIKTEIMSFAGSWKDLDQEVVDSLTKDIETRRTSFYALDEDWEGEDDEYWASYLVS